MYVGWSDGVSEPVLTGSDVELPETRTWSHFEAIVRKGSPVFAVDAMVNHTIPMKRQTTVTEEFKGVRNEKIKYFCIACIHPAQLYQVWF